MQEHMFAFAQVIDLILLAITLYGLEAVTSSQRKSAFPAVALIAVLLVEPVYNVCAGQLYAYASHQDLEVGAYIQFGSNQGEPLIWLVTEMSGEQAQLLCMTDLDAMPFDVEGSSYWPDSSLREYLNGDFLNSFSENEAGLLRTVDNEFLLSMETREFAERGERDFYCTHIPEYSYRGYKNAYSSSASDLVCLPDIRLIGTLISDYVTVGSGF